MRLRPRIATALALLLAALCAALPGTAAAETTRERIQKDCTDGQINGHYSKAQLADALAHLPADADEYTDCSDVIQRAELSGNSGSSSSGGGGGGSTGGGGGTTGGGTSGGGTAGTGSASGDADAATAPAPDPLAAATAEQRAAFQRAVAAGSAPVQLDGRPIHPGELGGTRSSGLSDLPTPLIAILALFILAGLGAAGFGTRRLVHGRRPA
jgi:hypothetical protein